MKLKNKNKNSVLRDVFAAKAMAAFISISGADNFEDDEHDPHNSMSLIPGTTCYLPKDRLDAIAIESYRMADRMLIAKNRNLGDYED